MRRMRWLAVAALVAASTVAVGARSGRAATDAESGCDARRPAVAHHPGGPPLQPQPPHAPIPCGVLTGMGGAEARIVVDRSGTVFVSPAVADAGPTGCVVRCAHAGLAISTDDGATWSFAESPTGSRVDNALAGDPTSARVFWIPFSDG